MNLSFGKLNIAASIYLSSNAVVPPLCCIMDNSLLLEEYIYITAINLGLIPP